MSVFPFKKPVFLLAFSMVTGLFLFCTVPVVAQKDSLPAYKSQELSDGDGLPVLIKHLPRWESVRGTTAFATDTGQLAAALGPNPVAAAVDFSAGTEAVTALYPEGRLLIVEYASPQASIDADGQFKAIVAESGSGTAYRRIGNYNAFVFDVADQAAAEGLLDQVTYEKDIQWLGDNPFIISAERAFVLTTADIFLSTLMVIVIGMGVAIFTGLVVGFVYFSLREQRRARLSSFTDVGGMTRLNLDGFTPDIRVKGLLND